jgi:hypothetical protein
MYFEIGIKCADNWRFSVPHREKPLKAKRIIKKFPKFAADFDGSSKECCLSWYYKLDKATGVFEFKDTESEIEVADLLGVEISESVMEDMETSTGSVKSLTAEEIAAVKEHLADIREGLKMFEADKK